MGKRAQFAEMMVNNTGNARAGKHYREVTLSDGRTAHVYADGTQVVVAGSGGSGGGPTRARKKMLGTFAERLTAKSEPGNEKSYMQYVSGRRVNRNG